MCATVNTAYVCFTRGPAATNRTDTEPAALLRGEASAAGLKRPLVDGMPVARFLQKEQRACKLIRVHH